MQNQSIIAEAKLRGAALVAFMQWGFPGCGAGAADSPGLTTDTCAAAAHSRKPQLRKQFGDPPQNIQVLLKAKPSLAKCSTVLPHAQPHVAAIHSWHHCRGGMLYHQREEVSASSALWSMWTSLQIPEGSILLSRICKNTSKSQSVWMQQWGVTSMEGFAFILLRVPVSTESTKKNMGSSVQILEKVHLWGTQPTTGCQLDFTALSPANFSPTLSLISTPYLTNSTPECLVCDVQKPTAHQLWYKGCLYTTALYPT